MKMRRIIKEQKEVIKEKFTTELNNNLAIK